MTLIVAFSGGKDSTALALRLAELGEQFDLLFTPTGNELPELERHIDVIAEMTDAKVVRPSGPSLEQLIEFYGALPNWRQRWCTRLIKIQPCLAFLKSVPGAVLAVGLRADEPTRAGIYGDTVKVRHPLQEWGWGVKDVVDYCKRRGVQVPARTDCAWCYGQRLGEWWHLWAKHPDVFKRGEEMEAKTGHTFRSEGRDTWPAQLVQLRLRFENGDRPRGVVENREPEQAPCRVCSL